MRKHEVFDGIRDTQIRIKVRVPDVGREFNFKVFKKTRVKEICTRLCELLDVDPLRTNVILYPPYSFTEMNHTSTLMQNSIEDGNQIAAKIHYTGYGSKVSTLYKVVTKKSEFSNTNVEKFVETNSFPVYDLKTNVELYGVKITGACMNPACIAFNKPVTFPMGSGVFDINSLLTKTKCQTCPYKDRDAHKPIKVQNISLVNCYWSIKGNYIDQNGFNNYKYCKNWYKTEGADHMKLYQLLRETPYTNPELTVRAL